MIRWPFLSRRKHEAALAKLKGRQVLPIIDQHGNKIGVAHRSFDEIHTVEALVDENGSAWMPPTAWSYMATCKALEKANAELAQLRAFRDRQLANLRLGTAASAAKRKGVVS